MQPTFLESIVDCQKHQYESDNHKQGYPNIFHVWMWEVVREDSTRLSSTAFVATTMEDTDMRSAAISGRSDHPSEL